MYLGSIDTIISAEQVKTSYSAAFIISIIFLSFTILLALSDIIRIILIRRERRRIGNAMKCKHLGMRDGKQICTNDFFEEFFFNDNNSCSGCKGKAVDVTDHDLEESPLGDPGVEDK